MNSWPIFADERLPGSDSGWPGRPLQISIIFLSSQERPCCSTIRRREGQEQIREGNSDRADVGAGPA